MSEPMGVREALEVAIAFLGARDRSENKQEAAAVLRRLLDSGFLEAAMEYAKENPIWGDTALLAAYCAFTKEPE